MKPRGVGNSWMNGALFTSHTIAHWAGGGTSRRSRLPTRIPPGHPRASPPLRKCFVNEISMQMLFYYYYATPAPRAGDI